MLFRVEMSLPRLVAFGKRSRRHLEGRGDFQIQDTRVEVVSREVAVSRAPCSPQAETMKTQDPTER